MSVVEEKLDLVLERMDELEDEIKEVKSGKQPDTYYKIKKNGNPTETTVEILKGVKKGNKTNGLKTSQVRAILQDHGFDYTRDGTRNVMQRLQREFPAMKYHSRVGAKGSELQWHPEN